MVVSSSSLNSDDSKNMAHNHPISVMTKVCPPGAVTNRYVDTLDNEKPVNYQGDGLL